MRKERSEELGALAEDDASNLAAALGLYWRALTNDAGAYARRRDRYRDMARTLGFQGHTTWAEAMP